MLLFYSLTPLFAFLFFFLLQMSALSVLRDLYAVGCCAIWPLLFTLGITAVPHPARK